MSTCGNVFRKLKRYGVKGVVDFVRDRWLGDFARTRRALAENARRWPLVPTRGVTLIADFSLAASLGKVMRDLVHALQASGIPYQTWNLSAAPVPDDGARGLTPPSEFRVLKYSHVLEMLSSPLPENLPVTRGRIAFWEFDSGIIEGYPHLVSPHAVVAMSDFNAAYFRAALPASTPVRKLLYPFRLPACAQSLDSSADVRLRYGIGADDFVVFYNFGLGSGRKNPEGAVRAFAQAFADEPRARLVFKTMFARRFPECLARLKTLAAALGVGDRLTTIDAYIPEREIYNLTNACDVYLSLHRGEGFGLGVAEAMSLGKAVVATDWSSTTEFCTAENSMPIPYSLKPIAPEEFDLLPYRGVTNWADPDIGAAARALRALYENGDRRRQLGARARQTMEEHFSGEAFRRSVDEFLNGGPAGAARASGRR